MTHLRLTFLLLIALGMTEAKADFGDLLYRCREWLDSADCAGCHPEYVEPTEQPWALYASIFLTGTNLKTSLYEGTSADMRTLTDAQWQLSASYRGYGVSYSHNLGSNESQQLSFSSYGNRFGAQLLFSESSTLHGKITADSLPSFRTYAGMTNLRLRLIDGYYVFNYRRFSYPAAFTCTVRQLRSCGSPIVGISYYHSTLQVTNDSLTHAWDDIHRLSLRSFSLGIGGAYNKVFGPNQDYLFHISAMPMAAILHKNRVRTSEGDQKIENEKWNEPVKKEDETTNKNPWNNLNMDPKKFHLTFSGRIAANYNYSRSVIGLSLYWYQNDIGSSEALSIKYIDWNLRAYVGVRF